MSVFCCNFASKIAKDTKMEAAVRQTNDWSANINECSLIDPDWRSKPRYSEDEFWNMAYTDLGRRYGLNDIRDAVQ